MFKKMGPHYAIERFGLLFLTLAIALCTVTGSIVYKKIKQDHTRLTGQAVYTRSVQFSEAGAIGTIQNVYVNNDRTKALILISLNGNMGTLPLQASQYSLRLAGSTPAGYMDTLKSSPTAVVYVLNSGFIAVYLQDLNGFPNQLLQMQFMIQGMNNTSPVYFNPGATNATHASFLEKSQWTVFDMIEETQSRSQEISLRKQLQDDLEIMAIAQSEIIYDTEERLWNEYQVILPTAPEVMANDRVWGVDPTGRVSGEWSYVRHSNSPWQMTDANGQTAVTTRDNLLLYFYTEHVCPGGVDFNWQDGTITTTGFLSSLTGSDNIEDWRTYVAQFGGEGDMDAFNAALDSMTWMYPDGRVIEVSGEEDDSGSNAASIIQQVRSYYQRYYEAKIDYEVKLLPQLLNLEIRDYELASRFTSNTNPDVLELVNY